MSDWVPLYISLILLFVIGFLFPLFISGFVPDTISENSKFSSWVIDKISFGYDIDLFIFSFNVNPYSWFGSSFQEFLIVQFTSFSYIPSWFSVPVLLIIFIGFLWSFIKLIPFT